MKRFALVLMALTLTTLLSACDDSGNPTNNRGAGDPSKPTAPGQPQFPGQPGQDDSGNQSSGTTAPFIGHAWCANGTLDDGRNVQVRYNFINEEDWDYNLFRLDRGSRVEVIERYQGTFSLNGNFLTLNVNGQGQAIYVIRYEYRDPQTGAARLYYRPTSSTTEIALDPCI